MVAVRQAVRLNTFYTETISMPNETAPEGGTAIAGLLRIMARLRDPETGCEWDVKQTHESIVPYTIEEAYEVAGAVESGDPDAIRDELGDLLLQVVFQARIAEEAGHFDFDAVAESISGKMVRRHPHVFGGKVQRSSEEQRRAWEDAKEGERRARDETGALDGVSVALPPVMRAVKLQKRAARVGFDWSDPEPVLAKVREELDEAAAELERGDAGRLAEEIGDLLFAVVNLARKAGIDPGQALAGANDRFTGRFRRMEEIARAGGETMEDATLERMEEWWREAKSREAGG